MSFSVHVSPEGKQSEATIVRLPICILIYVPKKDTFVEMNRLVHFRPRIQ